MVRNGNNEPGAWGAGKSLASATLRHLRARWSLFSIEGREAARWGGTLAVFGAAAAFSLLVAYLFFALSIGFTVAWLCKAVGGVWVLIMLGTSLTHVGLALIFARLLKGRLKTSIFPTTREELKKDFA